MSGVDVVALAARAGVAPGKTVNVVFTNAYSPAMLRTLTSVDVRREFGKDWLYWRWDRKGQTPWGTDDCGFAGNVIDDEFIAELTALSAVTGGAK